MTRQKSHAFVSEKVGRYINDAFAFDLYLEQFELQNIKQQPPYEKTNKQIK